MKDIAKTFYQMLIMLACVVFVIGVFFCVFVYEKNNVFEGVGILYKPMLKEEVVSDGISYMNAYVSKFVPTIKYDGGVQLQGSFIPLKRQFEVLKEDGSVVRGDIEDEFSIYLLDIKNQRGDSVLAQMTTEEIADIEEIPTAFIYEKEQDRLYCFETGIYIVTIKVYGANGSQDIYEFQFPVESN